MALIDTMGTLIGVSSCAGFLDERGNLPRIAQTMLCDALGPCLRRWSEPRLPERSSSRRRGCRREDAPVTAVFIAALFFLSLFFAPLVTAIPPAAYGPALVIIGSMMMAPIAKIEGKAGARREFSSKHNDFSPAANPVDTQR